MAPSEDQPIRPWIAHSITEDEVQPPRDFVDEIVHVTFQTAVVVACEEEALFVVEKHPTRKMNRADSGEMPTVENMPGSVIQESNEESHRPAPEVSRFNTPQCAELIGYVVVL